MQGSQKNVDTLDSDFRCCFMAAGTLGSHASPEDEADFLTGFQNTTQPENVDRLDGESSFCLRTTGTPGTHASPVSKHLHGQPRGDPA